MSLEQAPPELRQQLRAPSAAMPLLAQTTDPPVWLHSLVDVHSAPSDRPPVVPPPPHAPPAQTAPPQQWKSAVHAPPALRQQLNCPSRIMPLSLQTTAPPAWLHSELAPSAEHCPPSGTVFCARAARGTPRGNHAAANVAASPLSTLRRDVPPATARARSSNRNPSILASYSSRPHEAADPDFPLLFPGDSSVTANAAGVFRTARRNQAWRSRGAGRGRVFCSCQRRTGRRRFHRKSGGFPRRS
jgi:hypothetical protein